MFVSKFIKWFLVSVFVIGLTACGDGSLSSDNPQTIAIDTIRAYAEDQNQPVPTIEDYADAGVVGVTVDNLDGINAFVATLTASDVDTPEEIQKIVDDLGIIIRPTADAGVDQNVSEGDTVTLDGSGSDDIDGAITAYEWKEGSTVLSTAVSFTKSDFSVGTHTLTLTVTDNDSATGTDTMVVNVAAVVPNIPPTADVGVDQNVNEGDTVTLDGSGSADIDGAITAYEWKEGSTVLSTAVSFTKSDFSVGTHTLTLTVTDNDSETGTDTMVVNVAAVVPNIPPTADAGVDQNVNEGDTVTLDGSGSADIDGAITAYEWKEGSTVLSTAVSFTKSDFSVGTHTLTLTVTDNDSATGTDTMVVNVAAVVPNIPPTADAGVDQNVNEGDTVTLDGSGSADIDGAITAYEWKEGSTVLSTAVSFTKSDFSVGTHTLTLTVTDNDSATGTDTMVVNVAIPPTAYAGVDQNVNEGDTVTLDGSGSADIDGPITAYEWKEGSTVLSTAVSFTKSDFSVGTHTLTLTVTDNDSATSTDTMVVIVKSLALPVGVKKTGQTKSYDATGTEVLDNRIKDDGFYQIGLAPSYTRDIDTNVTTDHITGLMWQDDNNGTVGTGMAWEAAIAHCVALTLGGNVDWRLPTIDELMYIADRSKVAPAIDTTVFENVVSDLYWSSSPAVSLVTTHAWSVSFSNGNDNWDTKVTSRFVRCVRDAP